MPTGQPALVRLWKHSVASFGAHPALSVPGGEPLTFAQVDERAEEIAAGLRAHGAEPGAGVILALTRGPAVPVVMLGTWLAAGVVVPARGDADIRRLAHVTGARVLLTDGPDRAAGPPGFETELLADLPPRLRSPLSADHAYVMATTGSVGVPKLAAITHRTSAAVMEGLGKIVAMEQGEHALHTAAFTFSSSIRQMMLPLISGARVTVFGDGAAFSPGQLLELAASGVSSMDLTPSQIQAVLSYLDLQPDAPVPRSLRRLLVASEVFTPHLLRRWRVGVATRHDVFHLYGQTETGGAISALLLQAGFPESSYLQAPQQLPIAQPFSPFSGLLRNGADGLKELCISGLDPQDLVCGSRVRHEKQATEDTGEWAVAAVPRPTGDLFELNRDSTLYYKGRADAQVKVLGMRVDTSLIEGRAALLPGVEHVIVVAAERPGGGQALYVIFTASQSADASLDASIAAEAAKTLAGSLPVPRVIRLDEMPLNQSGKADRTRALDLALAQLDSPGTASGELDALWSRHSTVPGAAAAPAAGDFFAAGGDSLAMIGLLAEVGQRFGVRVMPEQFHAEPTLSGLRRMISEGHQASPPAVAAERPSGGSLLATAIQRGIWIGEQLYHADPSRYWLTAVLEIGGIVNEDRLLAAFRSTVAQFDVLRFGFREHAGEVIILPEAHPAELSVVYSPGELRKGALAAGGKPICLAVSQARQHTRLELSVHHAVADRRSLQLILERLASNYSNPDDRPGRTASFVEAMPLLQPKAADLGEARAFWSGRLPEPPDLPPPVGAPQIERIYARRAAPALASGATRHAILLWAFHRALTAAGLPQAQLIGVDIDLRPPGAAEAVGPYVQPLPVIVTGPDPTPDGPRLAMAAITRTIAHAHVPLSSLEPPLPRPTGDPRQPFYRYKLVYQAHPYPNLSFDGREARYISIPRGIAENSLTLFARDDSDTVSLDLARDSRAVTEQTARAVMTSVTTYEGRPHGGGGTP